MLYAVQMEHGMSAIGALSQLTGVQIAKIQADLRMRAYEQRRTHRDHRRQNLWRPEDSLFKEGSIGISCEKPTPNAAGSRYSR